MEEKKGYVLITGASSGIGASVAIHLSQQYNVILHGRNDERLQKTKSLCNKNNIQIIYKSDLSKLDEIENSIAHFLTENKIEINYYVHCAGFMKLVPLKMTSVELINETFATNIISAALLIKALAQKKINAGALKSVVLISSNISNFGAKAMSIYGASKGALDALMRSLAVELAPKIRVNSVLPGAIRTEMTENIFEDKEVSERLTKDYPLGLGEPADISEMVAFLLSEKSKWVTGQQFTVDGGRSINISA